LIAFLGDGTSTYFGMTGITGALRNVSDTISEIKSLIVASGNAYSEITLGDFRKVVGILPEDADENAQWYMNKKFYYNVVYPLAETAGVANLFEILSDRKGRFLLGYPVEFVSSMPSTEANSQICAILGDLSMGAYLGQRKGLTIAKSSDVYFANDQLGIRGIERVDVSAFGVGDTEEAGPIVALITAPS
jgi:HK97 family phage major capsid protein